MRLVLLINILFLSLSYASTNLCESASGCKCKYEQKSMWSISATCSGNTKSLHNITRQNLTKITITSVDITETTSLDVLRQFTNLKSLTFRKTEIAYFDWNWLPDNLTNMVISYRTSLYSRSKPLVRYPTFNQNCTLRSTLSLKSLYIDSVPYNDVPSCWPASLTRISFVGVPLIEFESKTLSPVVWPANVSYIYLKTFQFTDVAPRVFENAPASINVISINECKYPAYRFFSNWPKRNLIKILYVKNCHINSTQASDFRNLKQLQVLDMSGNNLMSVPQGLPPTLTTLVLGRNSIEYLETSVWDNLNNLTKLDIQNNELRHVPPNLPPALKILDLQRNLIEYSSPEALAHLKNLEELRMSRNRLISMPSPLTSNLRHVDISLNDISRVRSSKDYDYCFNCTLSLYGNPWICNENMIRMIVWATEHQTGLLLDEKCSKTNLNDLEKVELRKIGKYFAYLRTSKDFNKCNYSISDLLCVNASLSRLPDLRPENVLISATFSHNPSLTAIPDNYFFEQIKLTRLRLSYNSITSFPRGLPASLERLWLDGNQIQYITQDDDSALKVLTNLEELHLQDNHIQVVFDLQLKLMQSLEWVSLENNPLHCDCLLSSLTFWYQDNPHRYAHFSLPRCKTPASIYDRPITELVGHYRYKLHCSPILCEFRGTPGILNCSRSTQETRENSTFTADSFDPEVQPFIPENSYWKYLDFSYLELQEDDVKLSQLTQLETLDLKGNRLSAIPLPNLPLSLEYLLLSDNLIQQIPPNVLQWLPNIKLLDLKRNKIQFLSSAAVTNLPLINIVFLEENPFQCDCNLRPFVTYLHTQKQNNQSLIDNKFQILTCESPQELRNMTLIDLSHEKYCPARTWTKVTVGVVVGVSSLLLFALITIILLYKRRRLQRRKDILEGFRQLLENEAFENKDEKAADKENALLYEYDAFVSYCRSPNDENFVYQMLEVLEDERGKKFCIHERDFIPGQGISDNIVNCIHSSRRIILVISSKYTQSAWCQYEVQVALAQIHQQRRGKLLIPLLLEDVTKEPERGGSVKTILSLISGINVPSNQATQVTWEKFWNKLEFLMTDQPAQAPNNVQIAYEVD